MADDRCAVTVQRWQSQYTTMAPPPKTAEAWLLVRVLCRRPIQGTPFQAGACRVSDRGGSGVVK